MRVLTLLGACLLIPATLAAQSVSIASHVGTLGLGVDVAVPLTKVISVRAGGNFQPYSPEFEPSDLVFTLDLPTPSISAMLDVHPGGSGFRISVGAIYFGSDLKLDAVVDESLDIGNGVYTPAEIGTLTGQLITNSLAPYVGIGVGNAWNGGVGFFLDAGVAFHGTPNVELSASGPIASDPDFQADLASEIGNIDDDVSGFVVYPILSLGFRFAVGGDSGAG